MNIRIGYQLEFDCPQPTPMILTLRVHASRVHDLLTPDEVVTSPLIPVTDYHDSYGNHCCRIIAPAGALRLSSDVIIRDTGLPDPTDRRARTTPVDQLPDDTLLFLLGSRYCEVEPLQDQAWRLFAASGASGWERVQAVSDFVNHHIAFGYEHASNTRTASEVYREKIGVCRDYAHLAIALCRCINIPARYCTGYLGDMDTPPPYGVMDFAAWFEAYLDGQWHIFDPRNNMPRVGRILIARGRDAADVAISTAFGRNTLKSFKIQTDEILG